MFEALLSKEVKEFIEAHLHDDPHKLLLRYKSIHGVPGKLIVDQLIGRQKAKEKLPSYFQNSNTLYPAQARLAQSSSDVTAEYKCQVARDALGNSTHSCIDLTGGFGVDSLFFSRQFTAVEFVEPDANLLALARHNHQAMGSRNIRYHHSLAEAYLKNYPEQRFDLIYIDPDRRNQGNRKFRLEDCQPDLLKMQGDLLSRCNVLLIKASPILDISSVIRKVERVSRIIVVGVANEVKELLIVCSPGFDGSPAITAVDLAGRMGRSEFVFVPEEESHCEVDYGPVDEFLFEPNASILKAGAFKLFARSQGLIKLHANTHLYTSDNSKDKLPGRRFRVIARIKPRATDTASYFPKGMANILLRNAPVTLNEVKRKTGLREGGDQFLLVFRDVMGVNWVVAELLPD